MLVEMEFGGCWELISGSSSVQGVFQVFGKNLESSKTLAGIPLAACSLGNYILKPGSVFAGLPG